MAKQVRKGRAPNLPAGAFQSPIRVPAAAVAGADTSVKATASGATASSTRTINWQVEYGEILVDLKRTAVIAGILLAIMSVLAILF